MGTKLDTTTVLDVLTINAGISLIQQYLAVDGSNIKTTAITTVRTKLIMISTICKDIIEIGCKSISTNN